MNNEAINIIANILVEGALDYMASKANTTANMICAAIANDEDMTGAARYFAELVAAGIEAAPTILANAPR